MLQQSAVVTSVFYVLLFRQIPIVDGELNAGSQAGLVLMSGLFLEFIEQVQQQQH